MTYPEALRYLNSFVNYEKKDSYDYADSFNLERIKKLASLLGDPQDALKAIHVAGSKGKGSTSAIVYSILTKAGFRTGLYTSPHLVSFRERIRIGDELISEGDVALFLDRIKDVMPQMGRDLPSFFEVYTALACLYFKENKVDFAVCETGLGGRLDATNIVKPLVCAITPVSYEHTDKLGSTLTEIASEKGGIIKEGVPAVIAPQAKEAEDALGRICREKKAKLIRIGKDILFVEISRSDEKEVFSIIGVRDRYLSLEMRLLGSHQVVNAATAIGVIEVLQDRGIAVSSGAIREGIKSVRWAGRCEVAARDPLVILDGAQNRASAAALAKAVGGIFKYRDLILVLGVSKDKDIKGILEELLPISDHVILTKSKIVERAMEPADIKEKVGGKAERVELTLCTEEALDKARSIAGPGDLILVTGSLFVVGEARALLIKKKIVA